ncbi:hypothetical protein [Spirosoma pulveris]
MDDKVITRPNTQLLVVSYAFPSIAADCHELWQQTQIIFLAGFC